MAKTRKRKRKTKTKRKRTSKPKKKTSRVQSQWKKISTGAGALAFLSQVTGSDMSASTGQPIGERAKNFGNSLLGRITGYTPFKNAAGANIPQTISIDGIFNKWSGIGAASWIYGQIPVKELPHKGKAKTLGKSLLSAGVLGGLFSTGNPHGNMISSSVSTPIVQNAGVT